MVRYIHLRKAAVDTHHERLLEKLLQIDAFGCRVCASTFYSVIKDLP